MIGFSELIISGEKKVTKVELFEVIRKEHFNQGKSIRSLSRKYGIHRRMVRQALERAQPLVRKLIQCKCSVLTPSIKYAIEQIILTDKKAP